MQKVTITSVQVYDKKQDGTPYTTKDGKPFKRVVIKTDLHGEKQLSCTAWNADDAVLKLQAGDERTIVIEQNGDFTNFKLPTKTDLLEDRIDDLARRVAKLERPTEPDYPTPEEEGIDVEKAGNW